MKLSSEDKTLLLRWGYQTADFPQIEAAMQSRNTKYTVDSRRNDADLFGEKTDETPPKEGIEKYVLEDGKSGIDREQIFL